MNYLAQEQVRLLMIGILAIAAVSTGAATISSTAQMGTGSVFGDVWTPPGEGDPGGLTGEDDDDDQRQVEDGDRGPGIVADISSCIEPLAAWYGGLLYFGAFGGVIYVFKRIYSVGAAFLGMYAISPVVFTAYFLSTDCQSTIGPGPGNHTGIIQVLNQSGGPLSPETSPLLVAAIFGVAFVAAATVFLRSSSDQAATALVDADEGDLDRPDVADLAAAAGKAADRLEKHNVDADNAVYRAWWEMTSLLQVPDPETSTPGDFAEAAVDVGMDECHVRRLTELFEEVRYGQRNAESREERALDVFRSIEAEYSERAETGPGSDVAEDAGGDDEAGTGSQ